MFKSTINNPLDLVIGRGDLGDIPLMMMPEGATHMFPYEYPERVLEEVRKMMRPSAPLGN